MSTIISNLWQRGECVDKYTTSEIIKELKISRSYLYKIVSKDNIKAQKSRTGRYKWNNNTIQQIKMFLDPDSKLSNEEKLVRELGLKQSFINNRRYLGNKYSLSDFIKTTVENNCKDINIVADIFSGTGAVSNIFKDKMIITNDLLYSNYISNYAWFKHENYDSNKIIRLIYEYNRISTDEKNYMRENFADTFFSADDCSKIGFIREDIESRHINEEINFKEYAILITSLLYAMDKIANTVGHYDAYRKNVPFQKKLEMEVILPEKNLNENNLCFNEDAGDLVKRIESDLLYLDPPYNSRQYSDTYHLLENVARWEKPKVYGIAKKMDRSKIKSEYCLNTATEAFEKLINNSRSKYILLSYNNTNNKGNDRSNAKISDDDIIRILKNKGDVTVFEEEYKRFSTGKSNIKDNKERLFLCKVYNDGDNKPYVESPLNYMGGKFKILNQIKPLFNPSSVFLDLFAGGGNVGINSDSSKVIFNDLNSKIIELLRYFRDTPTNQILQKIDKLIIDYGLSNTSIYGYEYYGCNSNKGLSNYNKEKFLKLRKDYNSKLTSGENNTIMLYVLIIFSFNNQIRFNRKGEFNLPVGKRDFNLKMRNKLVLFSEKLKNKDVRFSQKDFRNIIIDKLSKDTFIYCDPPYLITNATYNENGMWTEKDEKDLLEFLDEINEKGYKFALSNVLESKCKENYILKKWLNENSYNCHIIESSYSNSNYQRKDEKGTSMEVLITNY